MKGFLRGEKILKKLSDAEGVRSVFEIAEEENGSAVGRIRRKVRK